MATAVTPGQNNVVVLGRRRAGKTSIIRTLVEHLEPKDAVGEDPTLRTTARTVHSFIPLTFWDTPGASRLRRAAPEVAHIADQTELAWSQVCALIYVIDAQDTEYPTDVACIIVDAYEQNPNISVHIFVHKIDGHNDETAQEIMQQVEEGVDTEVEYELNAASKIDRQYHMTSIYDSSIFVALSRVQRALLKTNTFTEQLDHLCDKFNTTCAMERTYIFDVPNRLYLATDNSPSDSNSFSTMSAYLNFLIRFSGIYRHVADTNTSRKGPTQAAVELKSSPETSVGRYASSIARLTKDISLAFWQLNNSLALVTMLRTETYTKQAGLLEYNIAFFRRGVVNLYELAQLQGPVLSAAQASEPTS